MHISTNALLLEIRFYTCRVLFGVVMNVPLDAVDREAEVDTWFGGITDEEATLLLLLHQQSLCLATRHIPVVPPTTKTTALTNSPSTTILVDRGGKNHRDRWLPCPCRMLVLR